MKNEYGVTSKHLNIYECITDILRIFIDTEIGGEVLFKNDIIADYIFGFTGAVDYFDCSTKEEIYEKFTNDILNGYPVWRMVELPEWTRNMMEREFANNMKKLEEEEKRKYKCLTCRHYHLIEIRLLGTYGESCRVRDFKDGFRYMKRCKFYEKIS